MTIRHVRVGDVVQLARRSVDVQAGREYREIGVRSFGRGIFHKEPVTGAQIGNKRVFRIAEGDLVVSNVFAWEGAVAVASNNETGRIGSHRFMTWVPDETEVDVRYLLHYLTSDRGVEQLHRASPGSAGRNKTLSISAFENILVPLPDLHDQKVISRSIQSMASVEADLPLDELSHAVRVMDRIEIEMVSRLLPLSGRPLGELAEINPRVVPARSEVVRFVPMADVDERTGTIRGDRKAARGDLAGGYKRFSSGDIIFARITPCMQNGKVAIFRDGEMTVGYGSTEFHVVRPRVPGSAEALHSILRTRWFRDRAKEHFTGTAGQQRVPASFLKDVMVPDMTGAGGLELASRLQALDNERRTLLDLKERRSQLLLALPQAARNEVFSKLV